jgi:hypothetical protein
MRLEKTELLKQEIIEYQKEAKRQRDDNYLIRQGHMEGRVKTFYDRSGDMLEEYVKTILPSMIKLPRNHPSGFDYKYLDSFFEIKSNKASMYKKENNNYQIYLEYIQNQNNKSKNNLLTVDLEPNTNYWFLSVDTSWDDHFGYAWLIDWSKAQKEYQQLKPTKEGGHNALGLQVDPLYVKWEGFLTEFLKEDK